MTNSNLPSTIGPVEFTPENVRLWCADAHRFDPIVSVSSQDVDELSDLEQLRRARSAAVLPMPIALLPSTSFIPKEYQIYVHTTHCLHCMREHSHCEIFAYNDIDTRVGMGKRIQHRVPVDRLSYNVPVRRLRVPFKTIPLCHECVGNSGFSLDHLPRPQDTAAYKSVVAAYQSKETLEARAKDQSPKSEVKIAKASQPSKPSTTKYKTTADLL